jgi:predicted transcriptional regulator
MKYFYLLVIIFVSCISVSNAQWEYQTDEKQNEIIFVNDENNNSSFIIERNKSGNYFFYITGVGESECKIESIEFRFDGIKDVLLFKVGNLEDKKLKILYDDINGLDYLKSFSKLVKERNFIYSKFINVCGININKRYTLKGSSKAINKINLIPYLNKTIKVTEAKMAKIKLIENSIPRLETKKFPADRLRDINPLEITEVYWKSHQNDKYHIKIKLKLNGETRRELFGKFKLFKQVDKIKSRY